MLREPNKVYSLAMGYVTAKVIIIAVELELDKYLTSEGIESDKLAKQFDFDSDAFKRFLRVLDAHEILTFNGGKVYANENTEQLADARSPHLLGAFKSFEELEYTLKTNKPCWDKAYGKPFYPSLDKDQLKQFGEWCHRSADAWMGGLFSIYDFSKFDCIADIGGGEGHILSEILHKNPNQRGVLFDQEGILKNAATVFSDKGCLERADIVSGDFFKSIPGECDLYIVCRTLLNWNDEDAVKILNVCEKNMPSHAKLIVVDFLLPEKTHPSYLRCVLSDFNLLTILESSNRTEEHWKSLVSKSNLNLTNVIIGDQGIEPEPFAPIIILECTKSND